MQSLLLQRRGATSLKCCCVVGKRIYPKTISDFLIPVVTPRSNILVPSFLIPKPRPCCSSPCKNGGTFSEFGQNLFHCICPEEFTGPTCTQGRFTKFSFIDNRGLALFQSENLMQLSCIFFLSVVYCRLLSLDISKCLSVVGTFKDV